MSRNMIAAGAAITLVAFALPVQAEQRQLGPHEHGHGNLNIAIEGNSVQMELDVPGSDIVGFEHEANTPEQDAQLKEAEARLKDALKLFVLPASALCKLAKAAVEAEHDESRDAPKEHAHDDGARHREYNATYALHCTNPQQIKTIHFAYFKMFPNARSLSVKIVSEQRQGSYEVTAAKPDLDLDPPGNQSSISQNRFWKSQARQTARSAQGLT